MSAVTVRNLPDATHRVFKLRATQHGRSTEAEIRTILDAVVAPELVMGTALVTIGRKLSGANIELVRDMQSVDVASFE